MTEEITPRAPEQDGGPLDDTPAPEETLGRGDISHENPDDISREIREELEVPPAEGTSGPVARQVVRREV